AKHLSLDAEKQEVATDALAQRVDDAIELVQALADDEDEDDDEDKDADAKD
ncbi:MAG: hypothetical protein GWN84_11985, partial [Gammaproteobacteria bacterium]|nr:hypothetical protein [Gammaproteobacteria bacterium]NIR85107.1 hypothetical protein [Gammaproteobacteria bacterium]NIU06156.1 hypothetical protein [Gammaproteobacteria bacterium]NIV51791.1 hypothetical protein [Gammaproteobacteria bacterium]NIX87429.1 hypothetical protein [Gammaproteobacteria bacterium]